MDNAVFEKLSPLELMALCIWAEARNQGLEGMQAVGSVILNRASRPGWWGKDIKSVILKPYQFSCLNEDDPQRSRMMQMAADFGASLAKSELLRACWWIAKGLREAIAPDGKPALGTNVGGATHYHTTAVNPNWKSKMRMVTKIKDHIFYTTFP